ncbi:MAG: glycosyltransferase family 4 protein [Luteimonas sp.]
MLPIWTLLFFLIGLIGTRLALRYAVRRKLLDEPGERRSHTVATPRGGGISIVIALLVASIAMAVIYPDQTLLLGAIAVGLSLVALVGWIDDHRPFSAAVRLLAHVLAAGLLAAVVYVETARLPEAFAVFVAAVILVNIWNFMDGIDGLAASQAVIAAAGFALVASEPISIFFAMALIAGVCGFLPFNFPKARIFLGDVGSGALGFALTALYALAITTQPHHSETVQFAFLLPLSAFTVDASLTLLKRIVQGDRWWTAHVEHAYQYWAARVGSHPAVTAAYAFWTVLGVVAMWSVQSANEATIMTLVIVWHLAAVVMWVWLQTRSRNSSQGRRA